MKLLHHISATFCLCLLLAAAPASAHQFLGGDITYTQSNGNYYEVTVRLYTNCVGGNPPGNLVLAANSVSAAYNASFTITKASTGPINPLCSAFSSNSVCNGGTLFGAEESIYTATLPFPANVTDLVLSVKRCCRNAAVTNLTDPATAELYFETTLNTDVTLGGNSSPRFFNQPTLYLPVGQNLNVDFAAYDVDGDSLTYELVQTKKSGAQYVQYASGYTPAQPLASATLVTLDSETGLLNCTPNIDQVATLSVLVREYRNGIQIGSVLRDIAVTTSTDAPANNLPTLSTFNEGSEYLITACSQDTLNFIIQSVDPAANQQLSIDVLQTPPGMTLSINSLSLRPHIKGSWAPDSSVIADAPYILYFMVRDNNCPANGHQTFAYKVYVADCSEDVLPGDANKDNVANMYDLLPIGLAYNTVGTTRAQASLSWVPQQSLSWGQTFAWGSDYKHADCDGNGIIDSADAFAILQNYNPLYQSRSIIRSNPTGPVLTMTPPFDTVLVGSTVSIPVTLGTANNMAEDVYGLVFSISYNGALIEPNSITVSFPNNSWVANNDPTISIWKDFPLFNRLDLGVTRIDRHARVGWGDICIVSFVMQDDITGKDEYTIAEFNFNDVQMVDHRGIDLPVQVQPAQFVLKQEGPVDSTTGLAEPLANLVKVYPNPAADYIMIESPYTLQKVTLYNTVGTIAKEINMSQSAQQRINTADLVNGMYLLAIQDQLGNLTYKKFLKKSSE